MDLATATTPLPFRRRLPTPEVLTDPDLTIPMRRAGIQVLPGRKTQMWTYGGTFPGPTIRRPAGELTTVTFQHRLGPNTGEMTVHLHGGHNRSDEDGQPGWHTPRKPREFYCKIADVPGAETGNELLIPPGGERTYTYDLMEDGEPERAAFQWYHDHRCERTAHNVWRGLAGMWILDDALDNPDDGILAELSGNRDIALMLSDRSFDSHNQLIDHFDQGRRPPFDQITGRHILVNGAIKPHKRVSAQQYRLRILNASNFRAYNLAFTGDVRMTQIATESGLIPAPLERKKIFVGPGERVEIVADFSGAAGKRVRLESVKRAGRHRDLGSRAFVGALMEFRVGEAPVVDGFEMPAELRPLPAWVNDASPAPSHAWNITVSKGIKTSWLINGKTFDPGYAEFEPALGDVVTWRLRNKTAVAHLLHLHHTDWYMLSRNGETPPPWERCLKETFLLDPGDNVVIAGKMSDYTGKYVVHCHMLDHEDHGLMSQFEVVEP